MTKVRIVASEVMGAYVKGSEGDVVDLDEHLASIALREGWVEEAGASKPAPKARRKAEGEAVSRRGSAPKARPRTKPSR